VRTAKAVHDKSNTKFLYCNNLNSLRSCHSVYHFTVSKKTFRGYNYQLLWSSLWVSKCPQKVFINRLN